MEAIKSSKVHIKEIIADKVKEEVKQIELTDEEKNIEEQENAFHDIEEEEADIVIDLDLT